MRQMSFGSLEQLLESGLPPFWQNLETCNKSESLKTVGESWGERKKWWDFLFG